jgi:hypothetical protein
MQVCSTAVYSADWIGLEQQVGTTGPAHCSVVDMFNKLRSGQLTHYI